MARRRRREPSSYPYPSHSSASPEPEVWERYEREMSKRGARCSVIYDEADKLRKHIQKAPHCDVPPQAVERMMTLAFLGPCKTAKKLVRFIKRSCEARRREQRY